MENFHILVLKSFGKKHPKTKRSWIFVTEPLFENWEILVVNHNSDTTRSEHGTTENNFEHCKSILKPTSLKMVIQKLFALLLLLCSMGHIFLVHSSKLIHLGIFLNEKSLVVGLIWVSLNTAQLPPPSFNPFFLLFKQEPKSKIVHFVCLQFF